MTKFASPGVGGAAEVADVARSSGFECGQGAHMALSLPEVRPRTAANGLEVMDLHDPHAALGHEQDATRQIEHLDAVDRGGQDALHELGVGTPLFRVEPLLGAIPDKFKEAQVLAVFVQQRRRFAARPKSRPVPSQMPTLVADAAHLQRLAHLVRWALLGPVLGGEQDLRETAHHLSGRPAEHALGT